MIWYWKYCSNVKYFFYIFEWVFMIWCFPDLDLQIIRYCFQDLFKNLFPPLFLSLPCCPSLVVQRSSPSLVPPLILSLPCCSNYSCLHPSHLTQLRSAAFGHLAKYKQTQIKINQSQIAFLTKLRQGYYVLESRPWKLWKYCLGRSDNLSWCKFFFSGSIRFNKQFINQCNADSLFCKSIFVFYVGIFCWKYNSSAILQTFYFFLWQ